MKGLRGQRVRGWRFFIVVGSGFWVVPVVKVSSLTAVVHNLSSVNINDS